VHDQLLFPQPLSPEQTSSHQHLINYLCIIGVVLLELQIVLERWIVIMSENNFWSILNRKENLRYPYSPQRDTFPKDADVYKWNIPRLLKSYACLGTKFLNDEDIEETINKEVITRMIRDCEDDTQLNNLYSFWEVLRATTTTTSTVIICGDNFASDEGLDWNQLLQVVFIHPFSPMKVSVYFVTISSGLVDVFAMGPCENEDLQEFALEIMNYLNGVLPEREFSFKILLPNPIVL
jgi:hypothetical protein